MTDNRTAGLLWGGAIAALMMGTPAVAQDESDLATGADAGELAGDTRIYEPAEFARFAPRSALDLLERVPGFQIEGESGERGLGQASGNVLINGQRLSAKSEGARAQLGRIPIDNVIRIEILDGATLDIPGLSGQVANVVVKAGGLSGQFRYATVFRGIGAPAFLNGNVSVSGASGALDYTLAFSMDDDVGASLGPTLRRDTGGAIIERRFNDNQRRRQSPSLSATIAWDAGRGVLANLNASHSWNFFRSTADETRSDADGSNRLLVDRVGNDDFVRYEIGGDIALPLGGGRLKLIGLISGDDSDFLSDQIIVEETTGDISGARFGQLRDSGERIGRAEYSWSAGAADWQVAAEAAFNDLSQVARLFEVDASGNFVELDFPEGVGGVREDRYQASISYGRPLADNLTMQATLAAEQSTLVQSGSAAASRSFFRPKGSLALAWSPADDLDIDFTVRRQVGQLEFGDFLARVFLGDERENAGNNDLRPPQSWEVELQARKDFGALGNATLRLFHNRISDLVDVVLVDGGESPGNVPSASRTGVELNGTLELGAIGATGMRIDGEVEWQRARLEDPLTGETRSISNADPWQFDMNFRHDVPSTDIAWGFGLFVSAPEPYFRITETGFERRGPVFGSIFFEHKDVFGMTFNARIGNPFAGNDTSTRIVYDGPRDVAPVLFFEERNRRFGPSVRLRLEGSF